MKLKYPPSDNMNRILLNKYKEKIALMISNQRKTLVEELHEFVQEIMSLDFEFPRHLLEPLF